MGARVVLKDVAALANVSIQTVSRVINGKSDVAEETRRRVWHAARQLGYHPNTLARSLFSHRSFTLGLLTCSVNDDFRAEVIMGAEQEARGDGYLFVLTVTEGSPDQLAVMCNLLLERQWMACYC
jgi:LacI family transcriptional regulator